MALLTPEEIKKLPHGFHLKHKCDVCGKPILSSLIFGTRDGGEACSRACQSRADNGRSDYKIKENKKVAKKKHDEDEEEVTKKSKKKSDDEDEEEESEEEEEEEETEEDEEEEKETPKKKRGRPAKKSKKADEDEEEEEESEEEEDEEEEKPKKKVKDKKKKKASDDEDEEEEEESDKKKKKKKTVERAQVGTKTNPYRDDSFIHEAFEAAKKGISVKDLQKMCKKEKVTYSWVIARFKKLEKRGVEWKYKNDDETIKITLKK